VAANKLKAPDVEESLADASISESTSNSTTTSHPSSPRNTTPPPSSPSSVPSSPQFGSPSKRGFVRLDHLLKLGDMREENIENSTMAIAALTALASGESQLIPSWDSAIRSKLQLANEGLHTSAVVDAVEGSGQLRISLVGSKRRPRKTSKKTRIYTF
jgi:hypothetical protein